MADERSLSANSDSESIRRERTVSADAKPAEKRVDHALRPRTLDEMIGQDRLRDKIKILVKAAWRD
ncbi:MAG: hypothetical protein R2911_00475 [Caldilineaceae bacterium]